MTKRRKIMGFKEAVTHMVLNCDCNWIKDEFGMSVEAYMIADIFDRTEVEMRKAVRKAMQNENR